MAGKISREELNDDLQQKLDDLEKPTYSEPIIINGGIGNFPANAINGQVSARLEGLTATNLVENGSFDKGSDGWGVSGGTNSVINGVMCLVGNGTNSSPYITRKVGQRTGQMIYAAMLARVTNDKCQSLNLEVSPSIFKQTNPQANTTYRISGVLTLADNMSNFYIVPRQYYESNEVANGKEMEVDYVICVDLTATFGAGNEPTKEQCDQIFARYFDGTKSTIGAKRIKSTWNLSAVKNIDLSNLTKSSWYNPVTKKYADQITQGYLIKVEPGKKYRLRCNTTKGSVQILDSGANVVLDGTNAGVFNTDTVYLRIKTDINGLCNIKDIMLAIDGVPYEPYTESTAYVVAKKDNKIVNLTTVKDTIGNIVSQDKIITKENGKMECVLENKSMSNVATSTVINYANMKDGGYFNAYGTDGENQVGVKGDTLTFAATTLIYQLAEPEIIELPPQSLTAYSGGTIYVEPIVKETAVYGTGITIKDPSVPIKRLERVTKINLNDNSRMDIPISSCTVASDGLSFTSTILGSKDTIEYEYEYDQALSTTPTLEVVANMNLKAQVSSHDKTISSINQELSNFSDMTLMWIIELDSRLTALEGV